MALSHDLCYSIEDIHLLLQNYDSYSSILQFFNFLMSIVICLVGLVGNAVVIWFLGFIMKKHKSKYWFLNLAIADFFLLLTLPFHSISIFKGTWTFGPHMCKLFTFSICANMSCSVYILIALNIAKVLSVAKPMFHLKFVSQRVSIWTCSLIWFFTILFSLLMFYYSGEMKIGEGTLCSYLGSKSFHSVVVSSGYNMSSGNNTRGIDLSDIYTRLSPFIERCSNGTCCGGQETLNFWNHLIFTLQKIVIPLNIIGYFIPLGIVIVCNITIVVSVRKSKTINTHRLYRIVLIIIMVFFITWTPLVISETVLHVAAIKTNLMVVFNILIFRPLLINIAYVNSFLNPIVYVLSGGRMQTELSNFISSIRNNYK